MPENARKAVTMNRDRELIRESEWMRVFKQNESTYVYESKFLVDDLDTSASYLKSRWPSLTRDEKIEFASAFSCRPPRSESDQEVITFLIEVGPEEVWRAIARILPFYERRGRAEEFAIERIRQSLGPCANYYQALESLRTLPAVPLLEDRYQQYRKSIHEKAANNAEVWTDYLQCCKTLWTLTRRGEFLSALRDAEKRAPAELRPGIVNDLKQIRQGN